MGLFYIILLLGIIIGGAVEVSGGTSDLSATNFLYPSPTAVTTPIPPQGQLVPVTVTPGAAQNNLQLNNIVLATVTPTPTPVPPPPPPPAPVQLAPAPGGGSPSSCGFVSCTPGCVGDGTPSVGFGCCGTTYYSSINWCDEKPVIYLYPQKQTNVNVSLRIPGTIPVSIPHYPEDGWKEITASPDGSFQYKGGSYHELFYETDISPVAAPKTGIVVSQNDLATSLSMLVTELGLLPNERKELLSYWLPQLDDLNSPYIFISVFDPKMKEAIDHIDIVPQPDTFIQFDLYFHPLHHAKSVSPLTLPQVPPVRNGFTAVEWGGIIDK